jgi:hypothetical protein
MKGMAQSPPAVPAPTSNTAPPHPAPTQPSRRREDNQEIVRWLRRLGGRRFTSAPPRRP